MTFNIVQCLNKTELSNVFVCDSDLQSWSVCLQWQHMHFHKHVMWWNYRLSGWRRREHNHLHNHLNNFFPSCHPCGTNFRYMFIFLDFIIIIIKSICINMS